MELGFVEDFTSNVKLDKEILLTSNEGIKLNSGSHPSITIDNLLHFLPVPDLQFDSYDSGKVYNQYSKTNSKKDIVLHEGKLFQCLVDNTTNIEPEDGDVWLETNNESLILKSFISKVKDRVISDLKLTKRLINSQFIYEVGQDNLSLPGNYTAWVFESKGSDYITITVNELSVQALTDDPIDIYVINQGQLVDTLTYTPDNGKVKFSKLNYSFSGPGRWIFAINSQNVKTNQQWIDVLKYDGFICYTSTGTGVSPETAEWTENNITNGMGFNISVSLESDKYIEYNFLNFSGLIRATFEFMALQCFLHNSSNRSNRNEKMQKVKDLLMFETKDLEGNTVARRYHSELKQAKRVIEKTFDTQISYEDGIESETTSV